VEQVLEYKKKPKLLILCPNCGKPFSAYSLKQKFCNRKCWREVYDKKEPKTKIEKPKIRYKIDEIEFSTWKQENQSSILLTYKKFKGTWLEFQEKLRNEFESLYIDL